MLYLRQGIILAASLAGGVIWWLLSGGADRPPPGWAPNLPLWLPALLFWCGQTLFWFGWHCSNRKLLFYLSGAWIGVMSAIAMAGFTLFLIAGGIIEATGAGAGGAAPPIIVGLVLLCVAAPPLILLPRLRPLWPGGTLPSRLSEHVARSQFVVLQFVCVGVLVYSLMRV